MVAKKSSGAKGSGPFASLSKGLDDMISRAKQEASNVAQTARDLVKKTKEETFTDAKKSMEDATAELKEHADTLQQTHKTLRSKWGLKQLSIILVVLAFGAAGLYLVLGNDTKDVAKLGEGLHSEVTKLQEKFIFDRLTNGDEPGTDVAQTPPASQPTASVTSEDVDKLTQEVEDLTEQTKRVGTLEENILDKVETANMGVEQNTKDIKVLQVGYSELEPRVEKVEGDVKFVSAKVDATQVALANTEEEVEDLSLSEKRQRQAIAQGCVLDRETEQYLDGPEDAWQEALSECIQQTQTPVYGDNTPPAGGELESGSEPLVLTDPKREVLAVNIGTSQCLPPRRIVATNDCRVIPGVGHRCMNACM